MRFHQLEVGAQFEFQGEHYTKSTSLIAVKQDGSQKFMQRSATVKPLVAHSAPPTENKAPGNIDLEAIKLAHEKFYQTCIAAIKNTSLSKPDQSALTKVIKEAQSQFLSEFNQD